jgi:hypothetical protein
MKNAFFACLTFLAFSLTSCAITSNTLIKSKESFVLGNNRHNAFDVKMQNASLSNLTFYQASINGDTLSTQTIKPFQKVNIKVGANTALVINNSSKVMANVKLKITGDVGLSMGYK